MRRRRAEPADAASLPLVFATMHLAWGLGFLVGCVRFGPPLRRNPADRRGPVSACASRSTAITGIAATATGCTPIAPSSCSSARWRATSIGWCWPGQLRPDLPAAHYRVPDEIEFEPLPTYPSLVHAAAVPAMARSLRAFWRLLGRVDAVWLLGPHPLCIAFALMAMAAPESGWRSGVRQDFPVYVRSRHPGRRAAHLAGDLLEGAYRLLARRCPTVVVGPELARNYRRARRLLPITVSLVSESDLVPADDHPGSTGPAAHRPERGPPRDREEPADAGRGRSAARRPTGG